MGAVRHSLTIAAIAWLGTTAAFAQTTLRLGTASAGGTYYVYGEAVAKVLSEKTKYQVVTQQTQGPNQNIVMVDEKKLELGMVTMGVAMQGMRGTGPWTKGKKYENIRALFPMYEMTLQCLALEKSGLASFKQLEGKTVGVGPKAGTPGTYFPLIFDALGMKVHVRHGQSADQGVQLGDGVLDAFCFGAGLPIPVFSDLDRSQQVSFFAWTDAEISGIRKALPEFSDATIPKGHYKQQPADQKTVGLFNFAIANKDLPVDIAYTVTRTILENNAAMVRSHPAAQETIAANAARNAFLPFHPGAVRYYKEKGVKLDPGALPK